MFQYLKCIGLVIGCFILGSVILALIPFFTILGLGSLGMFIVYCLVQMSKLDIDAEVTELKKSRESNGTK